MKPPIFVRDLSKKERERLEAGLRSKDAFVMRRCQILLASARGNSPPKIAENRKPWVRFANGEECHTRLRREGHRRAHARLLSPQARACRIRREKRRGFKGDAPPLSEGVRTRVESVDFEEGLSEEHVSGETVRATLSRVLGVRWMRAKRWITSPDPL